MSTNHAGAALRTGGARADYSGTAVAAIIFSAMLAGLVYRYWPDDERSIRRHLSNLAEALSLPSTDTEVQRITRFAVLREYFTQDVRIRVEGREIVSREALIGLLEQMKPPPGGAVVDFVNVTVSLADDQTAAKVVLLAQLSTTNASTGVSTVDQRDVDLALKKVGGDWVIASAEIRGVR